MLLNWIAGKHLKLANSINCVQRLWKFSNIYCTSTFAHGPRPMMAISSTSKQKSQLGTITRYQKLSLTLVPSLKRLPGPSLLLLPRTPPVEFPPHLFATSKAGKTSTDFIIRPNDLVSIGPLSQRLWDDQLSLSADLPILITILKLSVMGSMGIFFLKFFYWILITNFSIKHDLARSCSQFCHPRSQFWEPKLKTWSWQIMFYVI